ncbi:hypothetical protein ABEB36_002722 [Hypothenemus hampei]|uniref:Uncharacterized protein n=1 Tax=Hypothenemus hampei TaxID=57062 RepID=A0ABD1F755_HYPHA
MSTARRLVLSLRGRKQSQDSTTGRFVGGTAYKGAISSGDCHELDEIAVVSSSANPLHLKYGGELAGSQSTVCNGPRLVPEREIDCRNNSNTSKTTKGAIKV